MEQYDNGVGTISERKKLPIKLLNCFAEIQDYLLSLLLSCLQHVHLLQRLF